MKDLESMMEHLQHQNADVDCWYTRNLCMALLGLLSTYSLKWITKNFSEIFCAIIDSSVSVKWLFNTFELLHSELRNRLEKEEPEKLHISQELQWRIKIKLVYILIFCCCF